MNTPLSQADVILFFALPVGDEALMLGFWGRDVEQALATASPAVHFKADLMKDMALRFQREKGYRTYRSDWRDLECYICVRVGFSERVARAICMKFMTTVDEWTEEFMRGMIQ